MPGGALNQGTNEPPPRSDWRMPKPKRSSSPRCPRPYQTVLRFSVRSRGKKNWWGGGKHATDPKAVSAIKVRCRTARVAIRGVRGRLIAMELPFGVHPGEADRLARCRERQAGVVEDRPSILLCVDDRLDVQQAGTASTP